MKPVIRKAFLPASGWWICSDDQTHGFGKTPREAWFEWFAWKHLGIYA